MPSSTGNSEMLDSTKIEPLYSELKHGHHIDMSHRGVMGTDQTVDHSRIDPLGGRGQYQHPAPHADSQGVVGRDAVLASAKVDPLTDAGGLKMASDLSPGLDDENIDAFRIPPGGEVREDMKP